MPYQGMIRDWLAFCYLGSFCLVFGATWLYNQMILAAFTIQMVFLPAWTSGMVYLRYNRMNNNVFTTWWDASVVIFQFFMGLAGMYLYAWLKYELELRAREEEIKLVQGKMKFPRDTPSVVAYPCMCKLWDAKKDAVIKRYDNMHQVDIRANILCPECKNRIELILE